MDVAQHNRNLPAPSVRHPDD